MHQENVREIIGNPETQATSDIRSHHTEIILQMALNTISPPHSIYHLSNHSNTTKHTSNKYITMSNSNPTI
jgi:hypothetical protein